MRRPPSKRRHVDRWRWHVDGYLSEGHGVSGMQDGPVAQRKAILQKFVAEIRVESRRTIFPVFRLPFREVREVFRLVGRGGLEPPTSAVSGPER